MFGKGALIIVFGFIMAFSMYQVKMSSNVLATSDNFVDNYMESLIHETSLSAMNLAINKVWDQNVSSDTFMLKVNHCSSRIEIRKPGIDTVRVKVVTWGHLYDSEVQTFVSQADSISAYFAYEMPISRYFWFTNNEGTIYWISKDTVWGPLHTNSTILTSGSPVFYGKVTAYKGISPNPMSSSNKAKFYGGWEVGVNNAVPTDVSLLVNAANVGNGGAAVNTKSVYDKVTTFNFQADGSVIRTVQGSPPDTVSVASIAPKGAVRSTENIRVKGVFDGAVSFYTTKSIYIDDNLVYADNPQTNPYSDDVLGLVANNNIIVTDNAANNNNCKIQACLMAINGQFGAQNYDTRPISGKLEMTGSIVQNQRGAVGTFNSGGNITHGFSKRYRFDPRLSSLSPPNYPFIKSLRLVAWWE